MASKNGHDLQGITCTDQQDVKTSTRRLTRHDSLYMQARDISSSHNQKSKSLGIVYGDIGTSPLYVYAEVFEDGINHNDDVLGTLGLILYTLALIPLLKCSFIALQANDNGEGGTFVLYSLVCRRADAGLIPNEQPEDHVVSNFRLQVPNMRVKRATQLKSVLKNNEASKYIILLTTMLGTTMVVGDGVQTPCISVLSAGGIKEATPKLNDTVIVWISVAILVALFMVQQFGTEKVDHEMGNINVLCRFSAMRIILISDDCLIHLLPKTYQHEICIPSSLEGPHCGLIPIGLPSRATTTTGLDWNLTETEMRFGGLVKYFKYCEGESSDGAV